MSTKDIPENHEPAPPLGLGSSEGLGPLPERAAVCTHRRYTVDVREQTGRCIDCGAEGRVRFVVGDPVAAERERWRSAAEYAAHQLEQARIWNGSDWRYNPLHPLYYRSALDRLRDVLRA
jgi:hypothetical protein